MDKHTVHTVLQQALAELYSDPEYVHCMAGYALVIDSERMLLWGVGRGRFMFEEGVAAGAAQLRHVADNSAAFVYVADREAMRRERTRELECRWPQLGCPNPRCRHCVLHPEFFDELVQHEVRPGWPVTLPRRFFTSTRALLAHSAAAPALCDESAAGAQPLPLCASSRGLLPPGRLPPGTASARSVWSVAGAQTLRAFLGAAAGAEAALAALASFARLAFPRKLMDALADAELLDAASLAFARCALHAAQASADFMGDAGQMSALRCALRAWELGAVLPEPEALRAALAAAEAAAPASEAPGGAAEPALLVDDADLRVFAQQAMARVEFTCKRCRQWRSEEPGADRPHNLCCRECMRTTQCSAGDLSS